MMQKLGNLAQAQTRLFLAASVLVTKLKLLCKPPVRNPRHAISLLADMREAGAEPTNQIPHACLIIAAARWLLKKKRCPHETVFEWHPHQTSGATEPDLRGSTFAGAVLLSAEVTTSAYPKGTIDTRMRDTLKKLDKMRGRKFYFVRTEQMAARARTKIRRANYQIEVVRIAL